MPEQNAVLAQWHEEHSAHTVFGADLRPRTVGVLLGPFRHIGDLDDPFAAE